MQDLVFSIALCLLSVALVVVAVSYAVCFCNLRVLPFGGERGVGRTARLLPRAAVVETVGCDAGLGL